MTAKYVLAALAAVFLTAALYRVSLGSGVRNPRTKTWLFVGTIFAVVSLWLFCQD